jgi:hypothetical protein
MEKSTGNRAYSGNMSSAQAAKKVTGAQVTDKEMSGFKKMGTMKSSWD